ncbi:MAG: polyprenyl synthetase family protein [Eubacteriales bacterium]|nr:polyprenyl synthetase family protein [Eubacteriales bacterium]
MTEQILRIWPDGRAQEFSEALSDALRGAEELGDFIAAANYACSGGKQIRPALLWAVAQAYNLDFAELLPFMIALELIHNYSLVHDDLPAMDNDDLRHGKPSCHRQFGEAKAILLGDYLLNRAYEILIRAIDSPAKKDAAGRIAKAAGGFGMIAGQLKDLAAELETKAELTSLEKLNYLSELEAIQELKTGALIEAAVLVPLDLALAPAQDYSLWQAYAANLGRAYQIKDDILDFTASEADLGKSLGKDERDEKLTASRIMGLKGAEQHYAQLCRCISEKLAELSALPGLNLSALKILSDFILEREF